MEGLRRTYGIAEPVRRGMELKIVEGTEWRPRVLGSGAEKAGSVHRDVLMGRDAEVGWEDVFTGMFFLAFLFSKGAFRRTWKTWRIFLGSRIKPS